MQYDTGVGSAHGLSCPHDVDQLPGVTPTCNLLRVANVTLAEAQNWCTAHAACAAFSYRGGGGNSSAAAAGAGAVVYFKGSTQLSFEDSNFHAAGQVHSGWLSQIKVTFISQVNPFLRQDCCFC